MTSGSHHASLSTPSRWVQRHADAVARDASVLDLACGSGRNGRLFLARSQKVTFVDIDLSGVADLASNPLAECLQADLETEAWPLVGRNFGAVLVVNYLWRPLFPKILAAIAPGGVLIYETFMLGQENLGRPRNPDFLLRPDELPALMPQGFRTLAFQQGEFREPEPVMRQRILVRRE